MMKTPFTTKEKLEEIIREIPTPFHIYDEKGIRENARLVKQAFSWNPGFREYFAVKAEPNPVILKILQEEGCGCDCSSLTELMMAKAIGSSGDMTMFSSNDTPDEEYIYANDMNAIINEVSNNTNGVEMPDTVLLAPAVYDLLESTPKSQYSDRTILEFLRGAHPEVTRWMKIGELKGAGTGATDMVIAGVFRPEYIRQENPVRFEQLPVQYRNLEYVVPCVSRTLGVTINVPICFASAYGM